MQLRTFAFLLFIASILAFSHGATGGKGKRDFTVTVQMEKIENVPPESPAAAPGIKSDDHIIELNRVAVAGESAKAMYGQLRNLREVDRVRLKLQHGNGVMVVQLIARE